MFIRRQKTKKKQINKQVLINKKKARDFFAFDRIYEDGTIELIESGKGKKALRRFARIIKFSDINYQLASHDEQVAIFSKYAEFISMFDPEIQVQILITNQEVDKSDVLQSVMFKRRGDNLDQYREEYNDILANVVFANRKTFKRDKYLIFSFPGESYDIVRPQLNKILQEILAQLTTLNSNSIVLDSRDSVIELYLSILRKRAILVKDDNDEYFKDEKDLITPTSIKVDVTKILLFNGSETPTYAAVLFMRDYPSMIVDKLVSEISMQSFDTLVNIHFHSMDQAKAIKFARRKLTMMNTEAYQIQKRNPTAGEYVIPMSLRLSISEAEKLIEDLVSKGQRLFYTLFTVTVFANSEEELKTNIKTVRMVARKNGANLEVISFLTKEAFNTALPMGKNFLPLDRVERMLTTSATAILIPFTSMDVLDKNGIYYGLNGITQVPIIFNRTESLRNPNGFVLGTPGAGKSFMAKKEILSVMLGRDDDVLIIDPEREYQMLTKALGGSDLIISATTNTYINPMDINQEYAAGEGTPVELKSQFMLSLVSAMVGRNLTEQEKSIIDRTTKRVYTKYFSSNKSKIPTLMTFYNDLIEQKKRLSSQLTGSAIEENVLSNLILSLELYTQGSLSMFSKESNINVNNRFVTFDIKDLDKEIRRIGMLIVLDQIWNRISLNRAKRKRTWLYIDEIYLLFQDDYSTAYLYQLFKRARKWGAVITGLTQNVEDLLKNTSVRTMLSNSDFVILFNQNPSDIEIIADTLKLSPQEVRYITSAPPGQGIIGIDHKWIPIFDKFPSNNSIYKVMTTKFGET